MSEENIPEDDLQERLVLCFESLAKSIGGIHDELRKAGTRFWPEPKPQREAILTRTESDKEKELRQQGAWRRTAEEITDPEAEEFPDEEIGSRTAAWLREHPSEKS
jgi:hypothetical protein